MRFLLSTILALCCIPAMAEMPRYETKYYILYTNVPREQAQEAALRMSKMAEEYHNRTSGFSGAVRSKFPFYLFSNRDDYLVAGGVVGTDGLFNGTALYAVGGEHFTDRTWHVVQHEGFHQFASAVIGGDRPMWINEGLAEYFGEALFTGDGFVSGIIPEWRRKRVCDEMRQNKFLGVERMMNLTNEEWNAHITTINYDQAWSMVHFLAHGENGKYQKAFSAMMVELSHGTQPQQAWLDNFGAVAGFEDRWKAYWLALPENASADFYLQSTVARLTSFLARAAAQKQTFASYDDFHAAAMSGKLKPSQTDWLPPTLLTTALADADDLTKVGARWTLTTKPSTQIRCVTSDGLKCSGTYQLRGTQIVHVEAKLDSKFKQ